MSGEDRLELDYERLAREYRRLRDYTEGLEMALRQLPAAVTGGVADLTAGSPLRGGYEPPVAPG